jgi:hypothetical protein
MLVSCGIQQQIPRKETALRSAGSLSSAFAEPKEALLPGDGNESNNLCLVRQSPKYNLRNDVERREVQCNVTVSGSILQLADDDSTSTLNLEKKRKDKRLW